MHVWGLLMTRSYVLLTNDLISYARYIDLGIPSINCENDDCTLGT